ncbi:hypothetical protein RFI_02604, partial [Reticulomyxa filosa]
MEIEINRKEDLNIWTSKRIDKKFKNRHQKSKKTSATARRGKKNTIRKQKRLYCKDLVCRNKDQSEMTIRQICGRVKHVKGIIEKDSEKESEDDEKIDGEEIISQYPRPAQIMNINDVVHVCIVETTVMLERTDREKEKYGKEIWTVNGIYLNIRFEEKSNDNDDDDNEKDLSQQIPITEFLNKTQCEGLLRQLWPDSIASCHFKFYLFCCIRIRTRIR